MNKHWILRTHDGVPVPPSGAVGFCVCGKFDEDGSENTAFKVDGKGFGIDTWRWEFEDSKTDIIAYRWIFEGDEECKSLI